MKVMCIAMGYNGQGPRIPFGATLHVKHILDDQEEEMYEFKEIPHWAYSACGFAPLSNICEVKMLRKRKKPSLIRRLAVQLTLTFRSLLI